MPVNDNMHWRLLAERMLIAAEDMLSEDCQAMARRLATDYDRLARDAEARDRAKAPTSA
jgi:hypothetical protein